MVLSYLKSLSDSALNACRLVDALSKAFPQKSLQASSTPGLIPSIQKDQRYLEALQLYRQQLEQSNRLQSQQFQAQLAFNQRLIELLAEWQANKSKARNNELQMLWDKDNWFSRLDRQETVRILGQQNHRLLILAAPPHISADCPASLHNNLKKEVDNHIRLFLNQHYDQNQFCPIEFYGDYFKQPIEAADVRRLQPVLGTTPTAVIYTDISDYRVYFHIGFWGMQGTIAQFDMQPWDWEQGFETAKSEGLSETQALRKIRQTIIEFHQLLAAFVTDWYYLNLNLSYEPQLFRSEIVLDELPQEIVEQYITILRSLQYQREEIFEQEEQQKVENINHNPKKEHQSWKKDDGNLQRSNDVNYQKLRDLLIARQWKEADEATYFLIRKLVQGRTTWIDGAMLFHVPKSEVHAIDQLWVTYSEGHFGFSVQSAIWRNSRFQTEFLQRIKFPQPWTAYAKRTFSLDSPKGALPCRILWEIDYSALYDYFF
jgi:hypothetical protein